MELNGALAVFLGGMLGPVLVELIKIAAWRDATKIKAKYRHARYWVCTLVLLLVSGVVVVLSGTDHVPILRAVQLGINAPALVAGYATAAAKRKSAKAFVEFGDDDSLAATMSW